MELSFLPLVSALWLGILTSINPCPLASNIAAVSFIMKRIDKSSVILSSGFLYTLGRMTCYAVLGVLLTSSLLAIPQTAQFLQKHMNQLLGPVLLFTGLFLLDLIKAPVTSFSLSDRVNSHMADTGVMSSFLLGVLFALSFCPASAAIFFGSLLPLSLKHSSPVLFPAVYGIGTGLPVIAFAFFISFGAKNIGLLFKKVTAVEYWIRKATGIIFILIGIYYIMVHIFHLQIL